jgi:hypothetical protein
MDKPRRDFVAGSAMALLGAALGGLPQASSARALRRRPALDAPTAAVLGAAGEILLPGARAAGIQTYVSSQLSLPVHRQVLMIKYLITPPFRDFYLAGLGALEAVSLARLRAPFRHAHPAEGAQLIDDLRAGKLAGWTGPPQPLLHFVLRNDALDVVYGTRAGFTRLGVPYMAHIQPPTDWPT